MPDKNPKAEIERLRKALVWVKQVIADDLRTDEAKIARMKRAFDRFDITPTGGS